MTGNILTNISEWKKKLEKCKYVKELINNTISSCYYQLYHFTKKKLTNNSICFFFARLYNYELEGFYNMCRMNVFRND